MKSVIEDLITEKGEEWVILSSKLCIDDVWSNVQYLPSLFLNAISTYIRVSTVYMFRMLYNVFIRVHTFIYNLIAVEYTKTLCLMDSWFGWFYVNQYILFWNWYFEEIIWDFWECQGWNGTNTKHVCPHAKLNAVKFKFGYISFNLNRKASNRLNMQSIHCCVLHVHCKSSKEAEWVKKELHNMQTIQFLLMILPRGCSTWKSSVNITIPIRII